MVVDAVLFDLDDTLFEQRVWLDGAWRRVAAAAAANYGIDADALFAALRHVAAEGSDRGRIIDRALERVGASSVRVQPLVDAFRAHRPTALPPYPGIGIALARLRACVPLALVTDGDPGIQRTKLDALGLTEVFTAVVVSDEMGREARKPDPAPFLRALDALAVSPDAAVVVGDRPDKDVAGAHAAGMRAIRVRTGEYKHVDCVDAPWHEVPSAVSAAALLEAT